MRNCLIFWVVSRESLKLDLSRSRTEIIFQVFFFSPQLAKNIANLSIQVDDHNNAKDLHQEYYKDFKNIFWQYITIPNCKYSSSRKVKGINVEINPSFLCAHLKVTEVVGMRKIGWEVHKNCK